MKKYNDKVKFIKSENDPSGGRRAWFEVSESEAIMLKFPAGTTTAKMTEIADAELAKMKEREEMLDQLQTLEEQAQQLKQQLGIE